VTTLADSGAVALEAVIVASIVVPGLILVVVCWIFYRAKKREEEAEDLVRQRLDRWRPSRNGVTDGSIAKRISTSGVRQFGMLFEEGCPAVVTAVNPLESLLAVELRDPLE
jgi:hypothetical protein